MLPAMPGNSNLVSRRPVEANGQHVLSIHYVERNDVRSPLHHLHGVPRIDVIDEYESALSVSWTQLTSAEYGWPGIGGPDANLPRDVLVFDLGPNYFGAAVDPIGDRSHLALNSRTLDVPEVAQYKLRAVAAHELVHLFQFEMPGYQYWPLKQGRAGEDRDPNWWLHEATALAIEAQLADTGPSVCSPLLWTWATSPERSIDSDVGGTLAAPFLLYLMRKFGTDLLSELYRVTENEVSGMRGCEMIACVLERRGLELASNEEVDCFGSGYCVDAAFIGEGETYLPGEWRDIAGPRALSGRFEAYPVVMTEFAFPINHLGCRYFEFAPTTSSRRLEIIVEPQRMEDLAVLRCEAVVVNRDGSRKQSQLTREDSGEQAAVVDFDYENVSRVVMVVSNCAYRPGFPRHEKLQFRIRASIE